MTVLTVVRPSELRRFAEQRGLEVSDLAFDDGEHYELPAMPSVWKCSVRSLPPLQLEKQRSFAVRFPEAIVYGGNLAVAYDGALVPGGYAYGWNWVTYGDAFNLATDAITCTPAAVRTVELDADQAYMLGMTTHFGHFFIDCLDRVMALRQLPDAGSGSMLTDGPMPQTVREMASAAGFDESRARVVHIQPGHGYRVHNLLLVTLASIKPALPAGNMALLRRLVLARVPVAPSEDGGRLYLGRRGVTRRRVVNQDAVESLLAAQGYRSFYPESHSLDETVAAFAGAESIVLAYGSAKFNLMFCRPGTRVICLVPVGADINASAMFTTRHLCAIFGLKLCFCVCRVVGEHLGHHSDIEVDAENLRTALER